MALRVGGTGAVKIVKAAIFSATGLLGCGAETEPRAQLLVSVDTTLPVVGQIASSPELSWDATVDTLRVDVIGADLVEREVQEFVAPEVDNWPLTFGVRGDGGTVLLRIRAFRATRSTPGKLLDSDVLDPLPEVAVDRLVSLELPSSGIREVGVVLDGDCLGHRPAFAPTPSTCIDADRRSSPPDAGISRAAGSTRAGTWEAAREAPCQASRKDGSICIPGGYSVLGHADLNLGVDGILPSSPLHPAVLSPFWMDAHELTVGQFRELVAQGFVPAKMPSTLDPQNLLRAHCTWLGADMADNDAFPLNCVTADTAAAVCAARGGALPTEAQWSHAARGRGLGRLYPWGDTPPECCTASAGREGAATIGECPGIGPEPVGSHPPSAECSGLGDLSRDGVADLSGSLTELTRDAAGQLDECIWKSPGALVDPVCVLDGGAAQVAMGGDWSSGRALVAAPLRRIYTEGSPWGFRCVYADSP